MQETQVQFLVQEDPLEKEMATPVFLPGGSYVFKYVLFPFLSLSLLLMGALLYDC